MNDRFFRVYSDLVSKGLCNPIYAEQHGVAQEVKSSYWALRTAWESAGCPDTIEAFILQYARDALKAQLGN
jgi:hypothetical protein